MSPLIRSSSLAVSLTGLLDLITGLAVKFPRQIVLSDINLSSMVKKVRAAQEFIATMDVFQIIKGLIHVGGHTFDLGFILWQMQCYVRMKDITCILYCGQIIFSFK